MAVATKAAAFGVVLRLFDVALISAATTWAPAFATLAVITIIVGNVGAIGQSSLKRLLAYSSVAQAGYMLAGVVVTTRLGISAVIFYLAIYVVMNLAAFAVIVARERETGLGDDISSLYGLGADRPWLAWPMTISMLALAGFPATAGFFGKLYLIRAAVDNGYAWLGIVIVIGSAVSLAYYLRVIAAVWMRSPSEAPAPLVRAQPVIAGGSAEADDEARAEGREPGASSTIIESDFESSSGAVSRTLRQPEVLVVAVACALVTIVFGIYPEPLLNVAKDAGDAIQSLI
jgi:NADH-quinone oxidoreductase subunit N